jgi:hypothetical protein
MPWPRVKAVVVPELHTEIIFEFVAKCSYGHTGWHCVFILHAYLVFVTKNWYPVFAAAGRERLEQILLVACAPITVLRQYIGQNRSA